MSTKPRESVLVYSCSGCSTAAQVANSVALRLDRAGLAEMSCIAGVGGGVKPLVRKAQRASTIVAIDGCPLHCVENCLQREGLQSTLHYDLSTLGISKEYKKDIDPEEVERVYSAVASSLGRL